MTSASDLHVGQRIEVFGQSARVTAVGPQQSVIRFTGEQQERIICNTWAIPEQPKPTESKSWTPSPSSP